jgi:hypothetical protein
MMLRRIFATLIIPISACYYLELHNAITPYGGVPIITNESSIGCSDTIEHYFSW